MPTEPSNPGRGVMSFAQQRLWFLAQAQGASEAYHMPQARQLDGPLDTGALTRAFDALVTRHQALRTRFVASEGSAHQHIDPPGAKFSLRLHDFTGDPDAESQVAALRSQEATAPFDLAAGPLVRGRLIVLAADRHVLLVTVHHMVSDGWSMGVMMRELGALYVGESLPPLQIQYADYAVGQRDALPPADQATYWKQNLAGAPELLELPADRPRPGIQDHRGGFMPLDLDAELSTALKALGRRSRGTLFMVLLAGWATVLSRLSGQPEVVVGIPTANRRRAELEGLIGFFVNTLALRVDVQNAPTVVELVRRVRAAALGAQRNQDLPFEQVVELLNPARSLAYPPVFQSMFAWQNTESGDLVLPGVDVTPLAQAHIVAKFDLTLVLGEQDGRITGGIEYAEALFDADTVQRFGRYLRRVLAQMAADPDRRVAALTLLDERERQQALVDRNDTDAYPAAPTIHSLFESHAARTPSAVALVHEGQPQTYGELNARANQLAHHLRRQGVGPDTLVAVCTERGPDMVMAVLAVLKAGGAYVPLDPAYPAGRLAYMLRDAEPLTLVTHAAASPALAGVAGLPPLVDLDTLDWTGLPVGDLGGRGVEPHHLAYVIYTSGSTGQPKGVLVEHGQLTAVAAAWERLLGLRPGLVHLQMASFSFDVFTADLVRALGFGGRLVLCPRDLLLDSAALYEFLRDQEVGFADFVPAVLVPLMSYLDDIGQGLTAVETVVCGSDAWTPANARQLRALCGPEVRIVNAYGVTEAAVDSTLHVVPVDGIDRLPIGRPLPGVRVYVLDDNGEPVPAKVAGEIHIGGVGVARGYLGRPGLTAERFTPNPFVPGERLYRTGDLGRWLPDGQLELLGRADSQVKIRGFRVEPGEVEACLAECPGVRDAVVLALGSMQLVAYYRTDGTAPRPDELRDRLAAVLPEYMVPAAFVHVVAWPLTPNGKLDRAALPVPDATARGQQAHVEPLGELEIALAALWADVLGVERVGRHDHFFALGGHSLLAMKLVSRIRHQLGREVPPAALFAAPTLAAFADRVTPIGHEVLAPIGRADRDAPLLLSFAQQRLWFLAQLEGASEAYHMPRALHLDGPLDRAALARALDALVARHEALRTRFRTVDGEPFQHIDPPDIGFALRFHELADEKDLTRLLAEEATAPFDLARGPVIRGRLVTLAPDRHVLLLTLHHIVSDGWSMGLLAREFGAFYAGESLPALPVQYADYAAWQRQWLSDEVLAEQRAYWTQALAGSPAVLAIAADRPRPAEQDYRGGQVRLAFDRELTGALEELGRRHGSTLFMVLLAGWALLLSRLSGQTDVVVGTPTANRRHAELEGLIGFLVNTLALRVDLASAPTVGNLLDRVRTVALEAQEHQDLPFEHVVELVNPVRSLAHPPLFQVMFAWQNNEDGEWVLPGVRVRPVDSPYTVAKFDLTLSLAEQDGGITGTLDYASALFDAGTAERYGRYLHRLLTEFVDRQHEPVSTLPMLDEHECREVVARFGQADERPVDITIQELFEQQAERAPETLALLLDGQSLSYGELNAQANQLAHHLRSNGVGPDKVVAVCAERSIDTVVGLVAVLKAGAAYVPLDPSYPAERLEFMLRDSSPVFVLTQSWLQGGLDTGSLPVLCLDTGRSAWETASTDDLELVRQPDHLAYVIYTSGSTGRPKGVAQTWRTADNMVLWQSRHATPGSRPPGRVLQFASISFDVSFQEIWNTLCEGGTLVLMSEDSRKDLGRLRRFIAEQSVDRAHLPAAVLQQIAVLTDDSPPAGCEIITAGEALRITDDVRALVAQMGGAHLYNHYGPTETHVASQHTLVSAEAADWPELPPIGRAIANTRLHVLDERLRPVPIGVVGELYIGGASLARGYLARPGLTAQRFVPDPFAEPGERMYRTGDVVRRLPDGSLAFVGRADDQIKVRGFRVEPGEVESVLSRVPGVREAAVRLVDDALVGYIAGAATVDTARTALCERLPDHMVPTRWVTLDRLPLTANGKVDRRALPAPDEDSGVAYEVPSGEREARLAEIWAEVLRREKVGRYDDFFALGGHSLLATRLIHTVNQRMSAQLSLRTLLRHPVLADLAARLTTGDAHVVPRLTPDPARRHEPFPLTDIQQAYWVGRQSTIELGGIGAHAYREISLEDLDEDHFTGALNQLISRHDMLRAVFHPDGTQQVLANVAGYRMPRQDLRGLDAVTTRLRLGEIRDRMSHQLFDACRWPLFEFALTLLDDEVRLHISMDALIVDAASTQILERELVQLYTDPSATLAPVALCFRDYVLAERALRATPRYEKAVRYWEARAGDLAPGPGLPLVRQPESIERPRFTRYDHVLPAEQWSALKRIGKQHGITPSVVLLTAFAQVLSLWSRQPRFTLSLPLFNRLPLHPAVNSVIGDFTSLVLLELEPSADAGFVAQARAVQERLWHDIDHAAVSGVRVNRMVSQARGTGQTAIPVVFNSTLSELSSDVDDRSLATALGGEAVHTITQTPQVWIDHTVLEYAGRLHFNWDSIDELFPDGMVADMFGTYLALLESLLEPAAWKSTLDGLVPAARLEPCALEVVAPQPLMHELFDRQALATPQAPAVLAPDRHLTYGTLRQMARSLAGHLQARGLKPGQLVAVVLDRGWEQVAGTLAVLYAGGAYLPIDPELPAERVAHLLDRAAARLALVRPGHSTPLPAGIEQVVVDGATAGPDLRPVPVTDTDIAYVIYTSGSTGTPKGVVIDHRGAVNTLLDVNERFSVGPADRVLAISSLSFDLSVFDIFGTLAAGAAVVVLSPQPARDPAHWLDLMRTHRVTVWNSVPALLVMLVDHAENGHELPSSLRLAMLSGDWIPLTLPDRFRDQLPAARVDSLGGATEASIWSIHFPVGVVDPAWRSIPYGRALRHQRFYVLDDAMRPRPTWVPGQLYIGGLGLAQGYWRDEATTSAAFVTHPVTGERLYRTGDLGRRLADGDIEFLGREDGQVKVHGYRVELGEIEATLEGHPAVRSAVLRLLGSTHEDKRLAAYVVGEEQDGVRLGRYLAGKLPAYMVPSSFTFLAALPLSANGKVDKNRLPEPALQVEPAAGEPIAASPAESRLVEIVQEVMERERVSPGVNLMWLGATSIDIVRISNALASELGFRPRLAQLMREPTVADLLRMYREHLRHRDIAARAQHVSRDVVEDPLARKEFKVHDRGRRVFGESAVAIDLTVPGDDSLAQRYSQYRSVRQFDEAPVAADALAGLLGCLSQSELDGVPKYLYGSAGGTYSLQAHLYVKPDRVTGVPGGAYCHDPVGHRLVALGVDRSLSPDAYDYFVNRPVFDSAAFALFLVAELAAIQPLYGEQSVGFCQIEAGAMAQLLTMTAPEHGLGLCGMGSVDTAHVGPLLELGPTHHLVYSMVGGARPGNQANREQIEMEDVEI